MSSEAQARNLREPTLREGDDVAGAVLTLSETPFSSIVFSSAPLTVGRHGDVAEGEERSDWPRVIRYGGGVYGGQKSPAYRSSDTSDRPKPARVRDRELGADRL